MAWGVVTPSEKQADDFRDLLTHGFYLSDPDTGEVIEGEERERILKLTRAWRGDMWKAFGPIDAALNPCRAWLAAQQRP